MPRLGLAVGEDPVAPTVLGPVEGAIGATHRLEAGLARPPLGEADRDGVPVGRRLPDPVECRQGEGEAQTVTLEDNVGRMNEGQQKIYYITADSYAAAKNSPHLEIFRKKGVVVLLMWERVDEWLMSHLIEFDGKQLVSVTRGELDLGELEDEASKQAQEEAEKANAGLVARVKQSLADAVKEVRVTHRLTDSPSCIVTDDHGMSTQMIKLMRAAGQPVPEQKYILELNPDHALVKKLDTIEDEALFGEWVALLHEQAQLAEQGGLNDPASFVSRINRLLLQA